MGWRLRVRELVDYCISHIGRCRRHLSSFFFSLYLVRRRSRKLARALVDLVVVGYSNHSSDGVISIKSEIQRHCFREIDDL